MSAPRTPPSAAGAHPMLVPSRRNVPTGPSSGRRHQHPGAAGACVAMEMITLSHADILPPRVPGCWAPPLAPTLGLVMPVGRGPADLQREGMWLGWRGCSWGRSPGAGNPPHCQGFLLTSLLHHSFGQMMEKWNHAQSLEPGLNHMLEAEPLSPGLGRQIKRDGAKNKDQVGRC